MSGKDSGIIDVGYPIYGAKFVNNKTIIVTGGGGEGNNGIPNKITAIKCNLKTSDKNKVLQKFREIVLPKNEDSPMCLDIAKDSEEGEGNYSVFVGCNQSTQLLKSMNINNNLRKYVFTKEEHLRFVDAAQLEEEIGSEDAGEYPKIVCLSSNNTVGCLMTSRSPSFVYIFNPELLELNFKFKPKKDIEILDFHLSPNDDGKTLCYITASSIETVSTVTGNSISSTDAVSNKALAKYNLSKIRFIDDSNIIVAASLKSGKGVALFQYSIPDKKILKQRDISTKIKGITAMDISIAQNLIAVAGNDTTVTVLRLSDFKTIKTFSKLHSFAITKVFFSSRGNKLASVSAANTLHVMKIPQNYSKGKSVIGTLILYVFMAILACFVAIVLQKFYENGQLEQAYELSTHYGQVGLELANKYGAAGYEFIKDKIKGENIDGDDETKKYFKMDDYDENISSLSSPITTSFVKSYTTEATDIASTISDYIDVGHNDKIDIRHTTKDIEKETKDSSLNTESFFNDTNNYIEETTINASNTTNGSLETADTYESNITTEDLTREYESTTANNAETSNPASSEIISEQTEAILEDENKESIDDVQIDDVVSELTQDAENVEDKDLETAETDHESEYPINVDDALENEDDSTLSVDNEVENEEHADEQIIKENENIEVNENIEETVEESEGDEEAENIEVEEDVEETEKIEVNEDVEETEGDDNIEEAEVDENVEETESIEVNEDVEETEGDDNVEDTESTEVNEDVEEPPFSNNEEEIDATDYQAPEYDDGSESQADEVLDEREINTEEQEYENDEILDKSNPDQFDDSEVHNPIIEHDSKESPEFIEDPRPVDSPIIDKVEHDIKEETVDDSRPADPPAPEHLNNQFDSEKEKEDEEEGSIPYLVDDSTIGNWDDNEQQTSIESTETVEKQQPSSVVEDVSEVSETEFSTTENAYSTDSIPIRESAISEISSEYSEPTKPSFKSSITESSTTKSSLTKLSTNSIFSSESSRKPSSSKLSKKPVTSKITESASDVTAVQSTTKKTQLNSKPARKVVSKSKKILKKSSPVKSSIASSKNAATKTRVPKSLTRKLTKSKVAKPITTSQSHDEL